MDNVSFQDANGEILSSVGSTPIETVGGRLGAALRCAEIAQAYVRIGQRDRAAEREGDAAGHAFRAAELAYEMGQKDAARPLPSGKGLDLKAMLARAKEARRHVNEDANVHGHDPCIAPLAADVETLVFAVTTLRDALKTVRRVGDHTRELLTKRCTMEQCRAQMAEPMPPPTALEPEPTLGEKITALLELNDEIRHQRNALGTAIARMAFEAGMYNGEVPLDGPNAILFCQMMAKELREVREERDRMRPVVEAAESFRASNTRSEEIESMRALDAAVDAYRAHGGKQ